MKLHLHPRSALSARRLDWMPPSWSEANPDGIVNAGLAENSLMHDWLTAFWERQGTLKIERTDLTYGTSILGSDRIFRALASYFSTYFKPVIPVDPQHIATSNGLSPMIEHVAAVISDPEDAWLLPAPWYNGFAPDLNATSQVRIASVAIPSGKNGTLGEVEAMEAEMQRRKREGGKQKVTAVLVTSPHNPLGFCYPREVLVEYARFAQKWDLWLVMDEVYANSAYDGKPDGRPFISILSIDVLREADCDPSRILLLYGMSKDFGANGFRGGALVCQHNEQFMAALASTAMPMRMGSPTDILWSALLESPELPDYLAKNRQVLSSAYQYVTAWLEAHDLPYTPANAGHFVLVDFRAHVKQVRLDDEWEGAIDGASSGVKEADSSAERRNEEEEAGQFKQEIAFLNKLVDAGVYLGPGFSYACPEPGLFRLTFSIRRMELEVALGRIERLHKPPALRTPSVLPLAPPHSSTHSVMASIDPRAASPAGAPSLPNPSPTDMARLTQATIQRALSQELSPEDRMIARAAEDKLMLHARRGFWLGTLAGALLALRSRWTAGRSGLRAGQLPRLFFPSSESGAGSFRQQMEAARKAAEEQGQQAAGDAAATSAGRGKAIMLGKAIGYGIAGSVFGTQIGVWSGKRGANQILEQSGRKEAIEAGTQRAIERAAHEISQMTGRKVDIATSVSGGTMARQDGVRDGARDGVGRDDSGGGVDYSEPERELSRETMNEGVGYSDRAPPQDQLPANLSDPITSAASSRYPSADQQPSRWDELRRSRAAPPSKWDTLREANSRASVPPSNALNADEGYDKNERDLMSARDNQAERERRRREFDALFEKEAKGGDDSMEEKGFR
ncbi:Aminotran_1_2 domain-containing protein [Rhodotorula toruloides]|nr:Aminotran_1_2 domain-containing protein [Rhodotorula toruloides]